MGEARRRKKLDSSYGKFTSLTTFEEEKRHYQEILDELHSQCEPEMKTLFLAEEIPENYQQIRAQIAEWIEKRLSKYRESDREILGSALSMFFLKTWEKEEISDVMFMCLMEILKLYLPSPAKEEITEKMEEMWDKFESK